MKYCNNCLDHEKCRAIGCCDETTNTLKAMNVELLEALEAALPILDSNMFDIEAAQARAAIARAKGE